MAEPVAGEPITLLQFVRDHVEVAGWVDVPEKIPWDDPDFSRRMLAEHLSQAHDHASRRAVQIDRQVDWLHRVILDAAPARVLDLGCGPGLYTSRLAALGHTCTGIDFAPAAIDYARAQAHASGDACDYRLGDLRALDFGQGFDLALLLFGELNAFSPEDARDILRKARGALAPGGRLLLEMQDEAAVRAAGQSPPSWRALAYGLFSDRPHLRLDESRWDDERRVTLQRFSIVDAETAGVRRYGQRLYAYSRGDERALLAAAGLTLVAAYPNLTGGGAPSDFPVLVAAPGSG